MTLAPSSFTSAKSGTRIEETQQNSPATLAEQKKYLPQDRPRRRRVDNILDIGYLYSPNPQHAAPGLDRARRR